MTRWVPPPSPPGYCHVTRPEFSYASTGPHPQLGLCMGGEGSLWAPPYVTARAPSLWRRTGYRGLLSSYTHNFIRLLNPIPQQRLRIALYNCLCVRSIVTRRCGMGYKIQPWGSKLIWLAISKFFAKISKKLPKIQIFCNLLRNNAKCSQICLYIILTQISITEKAIS